MQVPEENLCSMSVKNKLAMSHTIATHFSLGTLQEECLLFQETATALISVMVLTWTKLWHKELLVMFWNDMRWKWNYSVVFGVQSTVQLQFMYNVCIHRSNAMYWYLAQDIYPCGLIIQGRWVGSASHNGLQGTGLSGNIQYPIILVSLDQMFSQYSVPFGNIPPPSEYYTVVYRDWSLYCMEGTNECGL